MDQIIVDDMSSLNVETYIMFLSRQRKIIMDQMFALKVKMDALNELIETEKSTSKARQDNTSLLKEQLLATASTKWSKNIQPCAQHIKK